ncbi:hypothetical protein EYB25_000392 [Talaromyces marneffei]|uniref:uncharacterized protein n=1 Tax=Talaromyces marneffei TaxID=37727 RepID=UPI0012AA1A52|nr:uncharacterized protein EYB26_001962 [Talaromyces marneffei]KAE8555694.1 hypothetical protein EYB25_000392 [Talaromyces marneffei]QGA14309.1 hypothetical protein EYB26_001962 [Talaromyces marneffei]
MSTQVGIKPAPAGQTVDFVDPPTQAAANIAMYTIMLVACTICLAVRMYTRATINRSFGFDDAFCIAGFAFLATYSGLMIDCGNYYVGRHIWDITLPMLIRGSKLEVWAEWSYLVVSGTVKLSYLLLYIRIFGPFQRVTPVLWTGVVFVSLIYVVLLMMSILDCQPIHSHWDKTVDGKCLPAMVLAYSSGAFNVVTDLFVLIVPMPTVWSMTLTTAKKLRVSAVFGLGIIAVSLSITRLAKTPIVFKSTDPSWDLSTFAVYSFLELSFGFICCCLLTFPAFLEHHGTAVMSWIRSRTNSSAGSNSKSTSPCPSSERRRQSPKTAENDIHSLNSYHSSDARLTFATTPTGLVRSADLETGELRGVPSSTSRIEHIDV